MSCIIKYKGQSIPEEQFLQYLNKQIAINNLFNENETIANAVYEALGLIDEAGFKETSKYEISLGESKFKGVEPLTEQEKVEVDRINSEQKQKAQQLYSSYLGRRSLSDLFGIGAEEEGVEEMLEYLRRR